MSRSTGGRELLPTVVAFSSQPARRGGGGGRSGGDGQPGAVGCLFTSGTHPFACLRGGGVGRHTPSGRHTRAVAGVHPTRLHSRVVQICSRPHCMLLGCVGDLGRDRDMGWRCSIPLKTGWGGVWGGGGGVCTPESRRPAGGRRATDKGRLPQERCGWPSHVTGHWAGGGEICRLAAHGEAFCRTKAEMHARSGLFPSSS